MLQCGLDHRLSPMTLFIFTCPFQMDEPYFHLSKCEDKQVFSTITDKRPNPTRTFPWVLIVVLSAVSSPTELVYLYYQHSDIFVKTLLSAVTAVSGCPPVMFSWCYLDW